MAKAAGMDKLEVDSIGSLDADYFAQLEKENMEIKKDYREIVKKFKRADFEIKVLEKRCKELEAGAKEGGNIKFYEEENMKL